MTTKPTFGTGATKTTDIINNTEPKQEPNKSNEIACLWERVDKYGRKYLRLKIKINGENQYLSFFKNRQKQEGDNSPNFVAFEEKSEVEGQ